MAIRLRNLPDLGWVALCAARSMPQEGDVYLDDPQHYALAQKFWIDYADLGIPVEQGIRDAVEREESNNPNRTWWDSMYATVRAFNAA